MPRAGVTRERILADALSLVDEHGYEELTLAAIAAGLGIRVPSLYKHVSGLPEVRELVAEACRLELALIIEQAVEEQTGEQVLGPLADVIRQWARAHPGRYAATVKASSIDQPPTPADQRATKALLKAFSGGSVTPDDTLIHRARGFRAILHGFLDLELRQGFGLPTDIDASWDWIVASLISPLAEAPMVTTAAEGQS